MNPSASSSAPAAPLPDPEAPTAAVYYVPSEYSTGGSKLMGRHVASEEFAKAYMRHGRADRIYVYARHHEYYEEFGRRLGPLSPLQRKAHWVGFDHLEGLAEAGCLMVPGPGLGPHAWQRRYGSQRAFSLCGVTHTIASDRVMEALGDFLTAPVQPWDALICTSQAVRTSVEHLLQSYGEYLRERLGATITAPPLKLPVIPLGIHCDDFTPTTERKARGKAWREKLGIGENDMAVLFVGRLSAHAKAHPLPMYRGLELAAQRTGKKVHLIQSGWFANDAFRDAFAEGAQEFCPSVTAHFIDGRPAETRAQIWHAADIFCSLSDNIQETFGLTPIEAMAAGLPLVVSDWDGYRDNIRDGEDGFLVPTLAPAPGDGQELAFRYEAELENYDLYCGSASQATSVDTEATARVFERLFESPELREKMGENGQHHAREYFDWKVIIAAYETLWADLAELRQNGGEMAPLTPGAPPHPVRDDPFRMFATYPGETLRESHHISLLPGTTKEKYRRTRTMALNRYGYLANHDMMEQVIDMLEEKGDTEISALLAAFPAEQHPRLKRTLIWLAKAGLARIGTHNNPTSS